MSAADTDSGPDDDEVRVRHDELQLLESQTRTLIEALDAQRDERHALIEELARLEREVATLAIEQRQLEARLTEHRRVVEALGAREREQRARLDGEQERLAELMRAAYVMGRTDRLRMLLNQDDPARAGRLLSYFAYFNRARLEQVARVREAVGRVARLTASAQRELVGLEAAAHRQAQSRAELEALRGQRAELLTRLDASMASRTDVLVELERDAVTLRALIEQLRAQAEIRAELTIQRESFRARRGQMAWPLLETRMLARFGTPKEGSGQRWDGVLLAAEQGEEVRAIHDGQVVYADWLRGFGLLLVLDHGDGYMSFYGHNAALLRELGEWVGAGDPVALGGDSGGRDRPVLYFAIRRDGRPQDPRLWCQDGARAMDTRPDRRESVLAAPG